MFRSVRVRASDRAAGIILTEPEGKGPLSAESSSVWPCDKYIAVGLSGDFGTLGWFSILNHKFIVEEHQDKGWGVECGECFAPENNATG